MKIQYLRKKIITNLSILGALLAIFAAALFYNIHARSALEGKVSEIKNEASQFKSQALELESKNNELTKYIELWRSISKEKKNTSGIKMDDVNVRLKTVAEKYVISSPNIKITLPETMKGGVFKRATVNILLTNVSLNFFAATDARALMFINEFTNSLPGYVVITSLTIKKDKKYTDGDLVGISTGNSAGSVSGKVDFAWYLCKKKDAPKENSNSIKLNSDEVKTGAADAKKITP